MKMLVIGGKGMAGHMMVEYFKNKPSIELYYTTRNEPNSIALDVKDFSNVQSVIEQLKPDIIINCVGLLNEHAANHKVDAIKINSLLPHLLAEAADKYGGKVFHISSDCVFLGEKGQYTENEEPNGTSIYAKTKSLGEINLPNHLTIRTSIIGPELKENGIGLFHWFMKQRGQIKGYKKVLWNGVTTLELAKVIDSAITQNLSGLYHLTAPTPISKHDLLLLIQRIFQKDDVNIIPDEEQQIDRTLKNTRTDFSYYVPEYPVMIEKLYQWMNVNG